MVAMQPNRGKGIGFRIMDQIQPRAQGPTCSKGRSNWIIYHMTNCKCGTTQFKQFYFFLISQYRKCFFMCFQAVLEKFPKPSESFFQKSNSPILLQSLSQEKNVYIYIQRERGAERSVTETFIREKRLQKRRVKGKRKTDKMSIG